MNISINKTLHILDLTTSARDWARWTLHYILVHLEVSGYMYSQHDEIAQISNEIGMHMLIQSKTRNRGKITSSTIILQPTLQYRSKTVYHPSQLPNTCYAPYLNIRQWNRLHPKRIGGPSSSRWIRLEYDRRILGRMSGKSQHKTIMRAYSVKRSFM